MKDTIRIGGASGAWGDSPGAIPQLVAAGVDYLVMDYLAEVTMSLLARAHLKDPAFGFPPDFVGYLKRALPQMARTGVKVVSNAGGVNPAGCKAAMEAVIAESGLSLKVAAIEGDDVLPIAKDLGVPGMPGDLLTANAYLGALPIAAGLAAGADIVITGRCADSALALGILMHEFGWAADDYDRLGAGSLTGHILECGPQATGGNFTDWEEVPGWENIGYPIASCSADGSFLVGKPEGSGGMITPAVIAEQTLYEIGDPAAYLLPDVVADFSHVQLRQVGPDLVQVSGARGRPPTGTYKVSATYQDGWRGVLTVSIVGVNAARKAERTAGAMIARATANFAARGLPPFSATWVEALGAEASYGTRSATRASRERAIDAMGAFIKDLAGMGFFMSDCYGLPCNTGLTHASNVALFDFDDLAPILRQRFRETPPLADEQDELLWNSETDGAWFSVVEDDVLVDEWERYLGVPPDLQNYFREKHGDLFTVDYWEQLQRRILAGKLHFVIPYPPERRLRSA